MALRFFENIINHEIDTTPDKMYRDLQQEFINLQWDNTTQLITVKEESEIGSKEYNDLDVWISPTVADTSTGMKDTRDFNKLIFKDITHIVKRGLMYIFDNCYWIVHSYNEHDGIVQDCGVRRCNNILKIKDPENGGIFSIPCVVDYDMAASTVKVTKYILTPNNHAVIMVQGNEDTLRLFKTNTRYMLSGRPFKLYGYQNAVEYDLTSPTTLLYLDLYLDEFREGDNVIDGVAENGKYDYTVSINADNMTLSKGSTGQLTATVYLNGIEVEREVVWESSNSEIISIEENGNYVVVGEIGESSEILVHIKDNDINYDSITISVGKLDETIKIVTVPSFDIIRQYETIPFTVSAYYNGEEVTDNLLVIVGTDSDILEIEEQVYKFDVSLILDNLQNSKNSDLPEKLYLYSDEISSSGILKEEDLYYNGTSHFTIKSSGISSELQNIYIHVICPNPSINKTEVIKIKATSMLG